MVFAQRSAFNVVQAGQDDVGWPCAKELKANGDDRQKVGNFGRFFPPPRMNHPDPRQLQYLSQSFSDHHHTIPYDLKEIVGERWDWLPWDDQEMLRAQPVEEIHMAHLNDWTRGLLGDIDDFANEEDMPGGKRWSQ